MKIVLNGAPRDVTACRLDAVLEELGYGDAKVATAVNEDFVARDDRADLVLTAGDRLEVVAPMQGG